MNEEKDDDKVIINTFDLNIKVFKLLEKLLRRFLDVSKE